MLLLPFVILNVLQRRWCVDLQEGRNLFAYFVETGEYHNLKNI